MSESVQAAVDPQQTVSANNAGVLWLLSHIARFTVPMLSILSEVIRAEVRKSEFDPQYSATKVIFPKLCGLDTNLGQG